MTWPTLNVCRRRLDAMAEKTVLDFWHTEMMQACSMHGSDSEASGPHGIRCSSLDLLLDGEQ